MPHSRQEKAGLNPLQAAYTILIKKKKGKDPNHQISTLDNSQPDSIVIQGIVFVSAEDVQTSIKESNRKTEIWTSSERLSNIEKIAPVPTLKPSNWLHWYESIQRLMLLAEKSAYAWWTAKLKAVAPHIETAPRDAPLLLLTTIAVASLARRQTNLMNIAHRFWTFQPHKGMSIEAFLKEYQKRFQDLREHSSIIAEVQYQMKYLFLHHVNTLKPDLANRCRDLAFHDMISECLKWSNTSAKPKSVDLKKNFVTCNYCSIKGHKENECRKKKHVAIEKSQQGTEAAKGKVLSLNSSQDTSAYQLDTAAEFHVSGYENDFSSYLSTTKMPEGIYVGTESSGGHIILNPETARTDIRRDIRIQENIFPLKNHILNLRGNNRRVIETALSGPKAHEWSKAIDQELDNMNRNNVWTLVPRPEANGKLMTGKWTLKENSDGTFKARWCARGFSEPFADDTYADVVLPTTMRMLLCQSSM
ncbi:hypothetical protein K3495_g476 [Podosphaera aphanis]|nr:hypothetical protein K3495_g476 [Podosphaera aphanis]